MKGMGKYESRLSGTILFPAADLFDRLIEAANFSHFFAAHVFFCFSYIRKNDFIIILIIFIQIIMA
jgi:hypothetical protein